MPQGERRPAAQGSILTSAVIRIVQPRQGTMDLPDHQSLLPKLTLPVTIKDPSGAILGPKVYSW